jgi:exopolyphosphatase/guanosine-5'-triphosphate,3'-diphosphate pyrophosphatase
VSSGRAAAVDIGSNSVRLLVVASDGGRIRRDIITTRLAAGVDATGRLDDAAIARTVAALATFRDTWETLGVPSARVRMTATSAVRDAVDRARFLHAALDATGVAVEVISGTEEAALSFAGATGAVTTVHPCVVIDVGGGSTELVVGDEQGGIVGSVSMQLGCVRLTERDLHSDPASPAELARAAATVDGLVADGLADLVAQGVGLHRLRSAVGVAGTATTLAALHLGLDRYEEQRIHGTRVPRTALEGLAERLGGMDVATRATLGPVQPGRAEVLHGGAIVLARTLRHLGLDELVVSEADSLDAAAASVLARSTARTARTAVDGSAP